MENKFTPLNVSDSSSEKEESSTMSTSGSKSIEERIAEGREWYSKQLKNGMQETPIGLLTLVDVKKAGLVLDENGDWAIPSEMYIADGNSDRPAGEKYTGISKQFISWWKARLFDNINGKKEDKSKQLEIIEKVETPPIFKTNDEIQISDIPF